MKTKQDNRLLHLVQYALTYIVILVSVVNIKSAAFMRRQNGSICNLCSLKHLVAIFFKHRPHYHFFENDILLFQQKEEFNELKER